MDSHDVVARENDERSIAPVLPTGEENFYDPPSNSGVIRRKPADHFLFSVCKFMRTYLRTLAILMTAASIVAFAGAPGGAQTNACAPRLLDKMIDLLLPTSAGTALLLSEQIPDVHGRLNALARIAAQVAK